MKTYESYPLQEVTKEDIMEMSFYSTEDDLRRAAAVKPVVMVPGSNDMPTLYYREERNPETGEVAWSVHALDVDVLKFLWIKEVESEDQN